MSGPAFESGGLEQLLDPVQIEGRLKTASGLILTAVLPDGAVGDLCQIERPGSDESLTAEIVGFQDGKYVLLPFGDSSGLGPKSVVRTSRTKFDVPVGDWLLGRVLDGLGRPRDGFAPPPIDAKRRPVNAGTPNPLKRARITRQFQTGIRAVDGLLTCAEGQRVGVFSAAGVGKSTFLGMIARGGGADVNVVALIGERGREVLEFIEDCLGDAMARTVVVVATSDEPALVRLKAAYVATTIAESFRDQGKRVLLMMDSVTRFARAQREVGLAAGEPPARAGFPPSVFFEIPRLLERAGNSEHGSITAFYNVLVDGDDMTEPVADEVRGVLDGHIVLSRELASANHFPAIDIGESVSRVMRAVASPDHLEVADKTRELIAVGQASKDKVDFGLYKSGQDPRIDRAIAAKERIESFLRQRPDELVEMDQTLAALGEI